MTPAQIVFLIAVVGGGFLLCMRALIGSWRETGVVVLYLIPIMAAIAAVSLAGILIFEALG